jgi:hypothetical protein
MVKGKNNTAICNLPDGLWNNILTGPWGIPGMNKFKQFGPSSCQILQLRARLIKKLSDYGKQENLWWKQDGFFYSGES